MNEIIQEATLPLYQSQEESCRKIIYVEMGKNSSGKLPMHNSANSYHKTTLLLDPAESYAVSSPEFQHQVSAVMI